MERLRQLRYLVLNWIAGYTNWNFVRAFGELAILTRASFSMLFFVPVLAALWPTVRWAINGYNEYLILRNADLETSQYGLVVAADRVVGSLRDQVPTLQSDLPNVWAVAFLASLRAVVGNVIYQTRAPTLIREYKLSEYEEMELKRYRENPTETQLINAQKLVDGRMQKDSRDDDWHPVYDITARWKELHTSKSAYSSEDVDRLAREYISLGAREQYGAFAYSGLVTSTVATVLYSVALAGVVWILVTQSAAVFPQAGWF